jgi:AcrR family transcriptional regulator
VTTDKIPLRQRKKERARLAIQEAALTLFERQGFDNTTVEEIAAVAEVSPSTVYRYFQTKDETVFWDPWDPVLVAALKRRPADEQPIDSLIAVIDELWPVVEPEESTMRRRMRLILSEPALRSHISDHFDAGVDMVVRALAARSGRDDQDLELRVVVNTFVSALLVALTAWGREGGDLLEFAQRAMSILSSGVRLPDLPA